MSKRTAARTKTYPVVAVLNAQWRVVDEGYQWILQRISANGKVSRSKYFGTRHGLLFMIPEYCGEVNPEAMKLIEALPTAHP